MDSFESIWEDGKRLISSKGPEYQLVRIEMNLVVTIVLLLLVVFLGLQRRCSSSNLVRHLFLGAYVGFSCIITYTMGMLHDISFQHPLLVVWAWLILNIYVNVDTVLISSLLDLEQRYRSLIELFLLAFWLWLLITISNSLLPIYATQCLSLILAFKASERLRAYEIASQSGLARFIKSTADYMRYEHEQQNPYGVVEEMDSSRMRGYKYLLEDPVVGEDYVTLEKLWEFQGLGRHSSKLKDICLSFALFKLLLRRFAGYKIYEASLDKTWEFVRDGLLANQGEYIRPFKVIEVELHFLYDFFYTKYCVLGKDSSFKMKIISTLVFVACCLYTSLMFSADELKKYPTVKIHGYVFDVCVTRLAFIVITLVEILQLVILITSNWTIVKWVVLYVKTQSLNKFQKTVLTKFVPLAHKYPITVKPWKRNLGQYSFLDNYAGVPFRKQIVGVPPLSWLLSSKVFDDSNIKLSVEVKKAVIESLISYSNNDEIGAPKLTNGITSLTRNGVSNQLSWACQLETQAQVVMVWHIATTIVCKKTSTPEGGINKSNYHHHFHVATSLSKYCAYLVAFAPDLLSEHWYTTKCLYVNLVNEGLKLLGGKEVPMDKKVQKLMEVKEEDYENPLGCNSILKQGGLLAQCILNHEGWENQAHLWKVLAEFWAEIMLFLAPSDKAMVHAEYLARGGEFITHLWALLTHAGILN